MCLEHWEITRVNRTGYPTGVDDYEYETTDSLGNDIYTGDEYYDFDGEIYLIESLSIDAIEILEHHGADRKIAK